MPDTPKKTSDQEASLLADRQATYGKPSIQAREIPVNPSGRVKEPAHPASTRAGVRAGFASWPEIPGPEKCNVHALHAQLLFTQWMAPEILQHFQLMQIENILRHAAQYVPYYRASLEFLQRLPGGKLREEHFASLPILTRRELLEHGDEITARNRPANHGDSQLINHSGATDSAVKIMATGLVGAWDRAITLRDQDWRSRDISLVNLDICDVLPQKRTRKGRWSELPWSGPSTALSVDRPIEHLFKDFIRIKPHYLRVRPSVLRSFLELSLAGGGEPQNLREVSCLGGTLDPEVRALVEKTWGVPVVSVYSAPETGILALQCPEHEHLHIQSEYARVEVLDDDNVPCQPGEAGRVVVTPLHNYQTPLVRYDTGDRAEAGGPCNCGRTLPVLARILGRP